NSGAYRLQIGQVLLTKSRRTAFALVACRGSTGRPARSSAVAGFEPQPAARSAASKDMARQARDNRAGPHSSQRGDAATTLECADLSALSAGDLSPSNVARRPILPGRWTRPCFGDKSPKRQKR